MKTFSESHGIEYQIEDPIISNLFLYKELVKHKGFVCMAIYKSKKSNIYYIWSGDCDCDNVLSGILFSVTRSELEDIFAGIEVRYCLDKQPLRTCYYVRVYNKLEMTYEDSWLITTEEIHAVPYLELPENDNFPKGAKLV